jgi:hypothetical protein
VTIMARTMDDVLRELEGYAVSPWRERSEREVTHLLIEGIKLLTEEIARISREGQ